jgi:hypothetical protein
MIQQLPNESPNPQQLAPGEEAFYEGQDVPYAGWRPSVHVGYPLNESLSIGIEAGRA